MKVNLIQLPAINGRLPQPIPVAAGQVIRVQVVKAEGSQVWLQLGGHVVKADARVELSQGDHLQLQVAGVRPDFIEMRVLPGTISAQKSASIITQLGLPNNPVVKDVVAQMVRFGLPLSPAAIMEMYAFIKGRQINGDVLQMLVWLKSIGVKATRDKDVEALDALKRFLRGDLTENEEIRFFQFLNQTSNDMLGAFNIWGWRLDDAHIYLVTRYSKQTRPGADNVKVLIRIDSAALQELWFQLEMACDSLNVRIHCQSEAVRRVLEGEAEKLHLALQSAGYRTGDFRIQVLEKSVTILDFIPDYSINTVKIDLQV